MSNMFYRIGERAARRLFDSSEAPKKVPLLDRIVVMFVLVVLVIVTGGLITSFLWGAYLVGVWGYQLICEQPMVGIVVVVAFVLGFIDRSRFRV